MGPPQETDGSVARAVTADPATPQNAAAIGRLPTREPDSDNPSPPDEEWVAQAMRTQRRKGSSVGQLG